MRHAINAFVPGEPERVTRIKTRITSPVHPGSTLTARLWKVKEGELCFQRTRHRPGGDRRPVGPVRLCPRPADARHPTVPGRRRRGRRLPDCDVDDRGVFAAQAPRRGHGGHRRCLVPRRQCRRSGRLRAHQHRSRLAIHARFLGCPLHPYPPRQVEHPGVTALARLQGTNRGSAAYRPRNPGGKRSPAQVRRSGADLSAQGPAGSLSAPNRVQSESSGCARPFPCSPCTPTGLRPSAMSSRASAPCDEVF